MTGAVSLGGRPLAFAEFGSPDGRPVLFHPAFPGSRLYGRQLEPAASELGFRVIAPDRPGIGRSAFRPGRTLAHTADDMTALADHLRLDRFDVVGAGEGAPHALACALGCGRRVRQVTLVNGVPAPEGRSFGDEQVLMQRALRWAARTSWANRAVMSLVALGAGRSPGLILKQMESSASASDRAVVARPEVRELITKAAVDAFTPGARGPALEMALLSAPWGLPLQEISAHVEIWHDEGSPATSRSAVEWMVNAIPDCEVNLISDMGQLWLFDHAGMVLQALLDDEVPPPT